MRPDFNISPGYRIIDHSLTKQSTFFHTICFTSIKTQYAQPQGSTKNWDDIILIAMAISRAL